MQTQARETIYFSRFPDAATPGALPLVEQPETPPPALARRPTYYSLHITDTGLVLVYRWSPVGEVGWVQQSPLVADSVMLGAANVPTDATFLLEIPADCPAREAFGLWVLR